MIERERYSPEAESKDHTRANLSAPAEGRLLFAFTESDVMNFFECPFNEAKTLSVLLSYSCTIPSFPPVKNCVGFTLERALNVIPAEEAEGREGIVCFEA